MSNGRTKLIDTKISDLFPHYKARLTFLLFSIDFKEDRTVELLIDGIIQWNKSVNSSSDGIEFCLR